jgi:hypothetical protein
MFLGSKGIDISQLNKHLEPVSLAAASHEPGEVSLGVESDIEIHLKTERSNAICAIAEMSMKSVRKSHNTNSCVPCPGKEVGA